MLKFTPSNIREHIPHIDVGCTQIGRDKIFKDGTVVFNLAKQWLII